jgi:hypothetical protein
MTCGAIPGRLQLLTYSAVLAPRATAIFKGLAAENSHKIKFARRFLPSTRASRRMPAGACGATSKARMHRKASHHPTGISRTEHEHCQENAQCDVSQLGRAARVLAAVSADATPRPAALSASSTTPCDWGIATPQRNEGWERLRLPERRFFEGAS